MDNVLPHWYQIVCDVRGLDTEEVEALGIELVESGAAGTALSDTEELRAFVDTHAHRVDTLIAIAAARGVHAEAAALPEENWALQCAELWQPVTLGRLTVIPVLDSAHRSPQDAAESKSEGTARESNEAPAPRIYLVPSTGFGTGHHATTQLVLELLQTPGFRPPRRCLDIGTGSGILALACAALYEAKVDAIDTDPLALRNAAENAALNPAESGRIRFECGEASACRGPYDLILANLYAELLLEMEHRIFELLEPCGQLIISGFDEQMIEPLTGCYAASRWELCGAHTRSGWAAMRFIRR